MFGRPSPEEHRQRNAERRAANLLALARPARTLHQATYGGTTAGPVAKTKPQRNRRLLDLAENAPCLLLVPGCCNHRTDTTVACHSNQSIHGKAGRRKADDHWSVFGCSACHWWLDFSGADEELKLAVFNAGMERQLRAWAQIAADTSCPESDRRAARWALALHGVTACA